MKTNETLETLISRRSTRKYSDKQVEREDLETILNAALHAPSGMNFQTWHFTAIRSTEKLEELNRRIVLAAAETEDLSLQKHAKNSEYRCYYGAPTLVIVSNEETQSWAAQDCACALENIFLSAHSLGISSCWINQLRMTYNVPIVREYLTELGVPENHRVFGSAALGYANLDAPRKEKKIKDGLVTIVD